MGEAKEGKKRYYIQKLQEESKARGGIGKGAGMYQIWGRGLVGWRGYNQECRVPKDFADYICGLHSV